MNFQDPGGEKSGWNRGWIWDVDRRQDTGQFSRKNSEQNFDFFDFPQYEQTRPERPPARESDQKFKRGAGRPPKSIQRKDSKENKNSAFFETTNQKSPGTGRLQRGNSKISDSNYRNSYHDPKELDIWRLSKPLFKQIPSNERFEKIFVGQKPVNTPFYSMINSILQKQELQKKDKSWIGILTAIQQKTEESAANRGTTANIMMPASFQASKEDFSLTNPHFCSIIHETMSSQRKEEFSRLLCSLVVVDEENKTEKEESKEEQAFTPHGLLPSIESHNYLRFSFEERLHFELQSIDLIPSESQMHSAELDEQNSSQLDLKIPQEELQQVERRINEFKDDIIESLPEYRKLQRARCLSIDMYKANMRERSDEVIRSKKKK